MKKSTLQHRIMRYCKTATFVILLGCTVSPFAQNKTINKIDDSKIVQLDSISGIVFDGYSHNPLSGARVQTIDLRYSCMTDESGSFNIKLPATNRTLLVSAPEYDVKEIPIYKGDKKKMLFLYPSVFKNYYTDELTVFGQKRKAAVVNSQTTATINNTSSLTLDDEIQKQLSGNIRVTTHSGTPATGSTMLIRGINSLNANTQPLIVVDGVIFDNQNDKSSIILGNILNPLSSIDVNDIEDISILKDGTSLYG